MAKPKNPFSAERPDANPAGRSNPRTGTGKQTGGGKSGRRDKSAAAKPRKARETAGRERERLDTVMTKLFKHHEQLGEVLTTLRADGAGPPPSRVGALLDRVHRDYADAVQRTRVVRAQEVDGRVAESEATVRRMIVEGRDPNELLKLVADGASAEEIEAAARRVAEDDPA